MIIYEISCATSLISSSSFLFDTNAQDIYQFDLSFAAKDLFIVAASRLTFSTIQYLDIAFSKLFVHPNGYGTFTVMYSTVDRIFYKTRLMIENQGPVQVIGIIWFI